MTEQTDETEAEPAMEALPEAIQKSPHLPWILIFCGFFLASLALWIFAEIADDMFGPKVMAFDKSAIDYIHSFNALLFRQFMLLMTETGSVGWITSFSLLTVFWLWRYKKDHLSIIFFIITVAGGGLLNYLLKLFFHRARPSIDATIDAVGFSFPSGHSMGSMIFYGFIGYLVIRSKRNRITKTVLTIMLLIFIFLIGLSRIYLNAHYPSDVIAGFSAGLVWLLLTISALRAIKWQAKKKDKSQQAA